MRDRDVRLVDLALAGFGSELLECVEQLRAEAGERQVDEAYVAVAQSARSAPSTSAAVVVLANDEGAGG